MKIIFISVFIILFVSCGPTIQIIGGNKSSSSGKTSSSNSTGSAPAITIYTPQDGAQIYNRNLNIIFNGNAAYTNYQINIYSDQDLQNLIYSKTTIFTNYKVNTNLPFSDLYISVKANPGGTAIYRQFTIVQLAQPVINAPTDSSVQYNKLAFSWNPIAGADGYKLFLDNNAVAATNGTGFLFSTNISCGAHNFYLAVTNSWQQVYSATNIFMVSNKAPIIGLSYNSSYSTNKPILINAGGSSDNEGDTLQYDWNGSGFGPNNFLSTNIAVVVTVDFPLSIKDSYGNIASTNIRFNVVPANIPQPSFTIDTTSGYRGMSLIFDASGAADVETPSGSLQVRWDWGDGGSNLQTTTKTAGHSFTNIGNYTVTLIAKDGDGFENSVSTNVLITNRCPIANLSIPSSVITNQSFSASAAGSSDPDGDSLLYRWDFGGGYTAWESKYTNSWSYSTVGTNKVALEVKDPDGAIGSTFANIAVLTNSITRVNLVGEWLFSGNANDSSGFSNNGTISGPILTNDRFGNKNSAYYFNGNSLISIPPFINLGIQSFTISYYLNMSATLNAYNMSFDFAPEACFGIDYNTSGARDKFSFWVGNNGYSWNVLTESSINFPALIFKQWYHVAVVYDQTNYYFYVNGQLANTFANKSAPRNIMNGFTFGNDTDHHDIGFNGILDDFRIYNYALSSNQLYIQGTDGI